MKFMKRECDYHAMMVDVSYDGMWNDYRGNGMYHQFVVTSLSRPGMVHYVKIKIGEKFNKMNGVTPKQCLEQGLVKANSSDEWYLYGGCQYYGTQLGCALYPEFRRPMMKEHEYLCSHTLYAVLKLICSEGAGAYKENFRKVLVWNEKMSDYE